MKDDKAIEISPEFVQLYNLILGNLNTFVISAAAQLGIADLLANGEKI